MLESLIKEDGLKIISLEFVELRCSRCYEGAHLIVSPFSMGKYHLPGYALVNKCSAHRNIGTPNSIYIITKVKSKILSSGWVVHIRRWFRRWGVDDLLGVLGDVIHSVMIDERLVE